VGRGFRPRTAWFVGKAISRRTGGGSASLCSLALPGVDVGAREKRMETTYNCAVELALDLLGAKWKPVLLAHLKEGPFRYSELAARIPHLSDKMLTQRLRELTELGFIERDGPRYRLTEQGERLRPVLEALYAWGRQIANERGVTLRGEPDATTPPRA
jgi:DNA-binding HxlR family transcriptional regulator